MRATAEDDGASADDLLERARRLAVEGDVAGAWEACAGVAERARRLDDGALLARAALVLRRPTDMVLLARVHALAREALARTASDDPVRERLRAQVDATRDPHGGPGAPAHPDDLADPEEAFLRLQAGVATLQNPAHVTDRLALADRAVGLGSATGTEEYEAWGRRWRMDAAAETGRPVTLVAERAAVAPLAEGLGSEWRSWLRLTRASTKLLEGAFDDCAALVEEARAIGGPSSTAAFFHLVYATELAVWTGADAERVADAVSRATDDLPFLAKGWAANARLAAGDDDGARHLWNGIRGHVTEMPEDAPEWLMAAVAHTSLCEATADAEVAGVLYAGLLPFAGRFAVGYAHSPNHGPVSVALGRLALVLGRGEAAGRHLSDGLAQARSVQALPHAALAHVTLAEAASAGSRSRAEHAAAAVAITREIGAGPLLRRAEALLPGSAGDPRLTPREAEVAALVADGLTNAAIARRLVLSERTVENHVAHALHKTGLPTRAALAAATRAAAGPPGPRNDERTPR